MRYKEIIEASGAHAINKLDIDPSDLRYDLYKKSIRDYTSTLTSLDIATLLHTMYRNNNFKAPQYQKKQIQMLDDIMYNHPLKTNLTLYHGLKENPLRVWIKYKVPFNKSVIVHMPAFTSTSTDIKKAIGFSKYDNFLYGKAAKDEYSKINKYNDKRSVLKMSVPAGTPGLSIKKYSIYPNEDEILLGRGINLQISPNPKISGNYPLIWNCKVLNATPKEHFNENVELDEESEFEFVRAV